MLVFRRKQLVAETFFRAAIKGGEEDPIYRRVRDCGANDQEFAGRGWVEGLWAEGAPFLDWNLPQRALEKGHGLVQAFAEMYFAHALKGNGISLVRRKAHADVGRPDLLAEDPSVHIEVVAPECGTTSNALVNLQIDEAKFILRLCNAMDSKKNQLNRHAAPGGCVREGEPAVIAVSGAFLQAYDPLPEPPYIVRSVLGVGSSGFVLDRSELMQFVEPRKLVCKVSGSPVYTDLFLGSDYSRVSAVLYSRANWICRPQRPGEEFVLVHNPNATCPLPRGWLPIGDEYWREGSGLRRKRHS